MPTRETGYALCVENRGAEDLEIRKVYRVLHDKGAAATGYMRVIDESGEDYLYPADYFVAVELPQKARRAWTANPRLANRRRPPPRTSSYPETSTSSSNRRSAHRSPISSSDPQWNIHLMSFTSRPGESGTSLSGVPAI